MLSFSLIVCVPIHLSSCQALSGDRGWGLELLCREPSPSVRAWLVLIKIPGIVNVFILATIMDVLVASWELIDREGLVTNFSVLYETMADVTSLAKVKRCSPSSLATKEADQGL